MNFSMKKVFVLTRFKFRELFKNKTFLISLFMAPGFTLLMRFVYQSMLDGKAIPPMMLGMAVNIGLLVNLTSISMMMPANMLAKEKEKNTLRTLMTSSVNGTEYFISAVIPSFVVSCVLNILILVLSGLNLQEVNLPLYILVTGIAGMTSCILGMLIGLFAKNQMSSSNISSIFVLVLMMVPMFASMIESLKKFSDFLYTGIVSNLVTNLVSGNQASLPLQSWITLFIGVVAVMGLFIFNYRKNGFEQE